MNQPNNIEDQLKKFFSIMNLSESEQEEYIENYYELLISRLYEYIKKDISKNQQNSLDKCLEQNIENSNNFFTCFRNYYPEDKLKHLIKRESTYIFSQIIRIIFEKANEEQKKKIKEYLKNQIKTN